MVFLLAVWLVKLILVRCDGTRAHRAAPPCFLGPPIGGLTAQGLARWVEKQVGVVWS